MDVLDPAAANPWLLAAAFAAGAVNSVAGGGTLLTFPALLAVMPSVRANATSTLALVPGALAAAWGYRSEVSTMRSWLRLLIVPSLIGGVIGALLLTQLPGSVFDAAIPWLILTATLLLAAQPLILKLLARLRVRELTAPSSDSGLTVSHPLTLVGLLLFQLVISIYGGYFGAGLGILNLAALGLMQVTDIHRMNGLKSLLGGLTNAVSVVVFIWRGVIDWPVALTMAVTAVAGGYLGARVARRLDRRLVRTAIVAIGLGLSAYYGLRRA